MTTYTAHRSDGMAFTRNSRTRQYTHAVITTFPNGRVIASFATSLARAEAESRAIRPAPPLTRADLTIEIVEVTA